MTIVPLSRMGVLACVLLLAACTMPAQPASSPGPGITPGPAPTSAPAAERVRAIQTALAQQGYDPGPIDGRYGRSTAAAIRRYQQDHQLPVDGQPSPGLLAALQSQAQPNTASSPSGLVGQGLPTPGVVPPTPAYQPAPVYQPAPDAIALGPGTPPRRPSTLGPGAGAAAAPAPANAACGRWHNDHGRMVQGAPPPAPGDDPVVTQFLQETEEERCNPALAAARSEQRLRASKCDSYLRQYRSQSIRASGNNGGIPANAAQRADAEQQMAGIRKVMQANNCPEP